VAAAVYKANDEHKRIVRTSGGGGSTSVDATKRKFRKNSDPRNSNVFFLNTRIGVPEALFYFSVRHVYARFFLVVYAEYEIRGFFVLFRSRRIFYDYRPARRFTFGTIRFTIVPLPVNALGPPYRSVYTHARI